MKTAFSGPLIIYGDRNPIGSGGSVNSDKSPSVIWGGSGLMDHRAGYNRTKAGVIGIWSQMAVDAVPSTLTTTAIAAAQVPVAGTPLTLVSASGAGITVLSAATQVWASGTTIPVGTLVIDSAPAFLSFGLASVSNNSTTVSYYDPSTMLARNVQIASVGNDSTATFTVRGYDVYGYAVSETITGANIGTATGNKAFKFVSSVTPAGTLSGANVSVGQGDKFGLPLRADTFGYMDVIYNNTFASSTTTPFGTASAFAFADTTTATATTGDVRGTVYLGTANASNGTRRLQIGVITAIKNISSVGNTLAMFGVAQA